MKLFFCHSSKDKPLVREIIGHLRNRSSQLNPWIDEREIRVADELRVTIRSAIESSGFVVALISASSVDSEWVKFELHTAYGRGVTVLPIIVDLEPSRLPLHIRDIRYLRLYTRSEREVAGVSQELCEAIGRWLVDNDRFISVIKEYSQFLQAEAINEGEDAATISLALIEFLPKFVRAVYLKEYAGIESEHMPPAWLVICCNFVVTHLRISDLSTDRRSSPESLLFIEKNGTLLGQCFFLGYLAMALRRPMAGVSVREDDSYDVEELWRYFDEVKSEPLNSRLDERVWNLGLLYVNVIYRVLISKEDFPNADEIEILLNKAMSSGFILARAVERVVLRNQNRL